MNQKDTNTSHQLLEYLKARQQGSEYRGNLSGEARNLIEICGKDLNKLARQAWTIHLLDNGGVGC